MRHMNYKPGYYLTYFIYCMIPVSIYVWYLCRRRNEDKIEVNDVEIIFSLILLSHLQVDNCLSLANPICIAVVYCHLSIALIYQTCPLGEFRSENEKHC